MSEPMIDSPLQLARITLHATSRRSPRSTVAAPKRSSTAQIQ